MEQPPSIPSAALSWVEGWEAVVVWSLIPEVVTWRLVAPAGEVRYLKVSQLGRELSLAAERDRMNWAASRLPVPRVLGYGSDATHEWLLTGALPGVNATDAGMRADPARLVPLLAAGLRRFHSLPVERRPQSRPRLGRSLSRHGRRPVGQRQGCLLPPALRLRSMTAAGRWAGESRRARRPGMTPVDGNHLQRPAANTPARRSPSSSPGGRRGCRGRRRRVGRRGCSGWWRGCLP